jgi:YegS/Rv2252/BmrU family lipid kinase
LTPRTLVIVNPHSGHGSTARRWRALEPRVREVLGAVEVEHTRGPRDAERLAREAVRSGIERVVIAGGDGTVAEVASGLLRARLGDYAELGLLPMGTGCDFARSVGVPQDPESALSVLRTGSARRVDAGHVSYVDRDGASRDSWFTNVASFGVSSATVEITARTTKRLGGTFAFAVGTVRALLSHRSQRVTLRVDGEPFCDERMVLVAVANGRCFGGGMRVAPGARLDDGRLEVVGICHTPTWRLLTKLPKLYRGTHLDDAMTRVGSGTCIEAEAPEGEVALEMDGEALGRRPVRIEVLPGALAVVGPKA